MIGRAALTLVMLAAPLLAANPAQTCRTQQRHGQLQAAKSCYLSLTRSSDAFARAEGYFGLGEFESANEEFRAAYKAQPKSAEVKSEWGRLYFEHYQPADAAKLFEEALEADPNYAPAYVELAKVFAQRFDKRAPDLARQALKSDPRYFPAHEELAYLALEDSDRKLAQEEAQQALAISNEALDAMAVLASIDWLDNKAQSEWMDRILKIDPAYGEAYETGGHFAEINYRYEDAIALYRKALALNEQLWSARSELGVNLMRLGHDEEARTQLEQCYAAHYRNPETVNSLRLLDSLKNYETFKTRTTELVLNKKEAALLRPYFEPELQRVVATYQRKYKMTLPGAVRLEVYPNHDDFVVRTLGLPGQGGLLGVTFGLVVAMDSPSARPAGELNWGSTMWHEMSHVFVLTATHHSVPRWFTEGLAVHEEGAASPDWGSRLTPDIITALEKGQLLPVLKLDRGFVRPEFPGQVLVSYYEAGKICDYIAAKWGDDALLGMIHSYAARKTTAAAIEENLHETPEAFDKGFTSWLNGQTAEAVKSFAEWKKNVKLAHEELANGKTDEAIKVAEAWRDRYPEYVGEGSLYEVLSEAYLKKNDKSGALAELKKYRDEGGTNPQLLNTVADLQVQSGDTKGAILTLTKLTYIYPEDQKLHQSLAKLALASGETNIAIRESEAMLALNPTNPAETHYQLAQALRAAKRLSEAKDQVLLALEAAPDYKPAQQLLLQLSQ
ncbi:MAG TPA: tetratricopeptide repeat protein [Bryobacteraceae bacterium]|jgi:tetratricopeptide (TPR) repeat protein|nr:tetratricopeptide repeat protein [Bryobacteraceae bacterium]